MAEAPQYPNQSLGVEGKQDSNAGAVNNFSLPIQIGTWTFSAGAGAPVIGGNVGDLYIRQNAATDALYFYRCTIAGRAGAATWTAITGA